MAPQALALGVLALSSLLTSVSAELEYRSYRRDTTPYATDVELPAAEYSIPLSGKVARTAGRKALRDTLRAKATGKSYVVPLAGSDQDEEYLVKATIGGQTFSLIVDTGSSDTWVAEKGFKCFDLDGDSEPTKECGFGTSGYSTSKSKTYKPYPNHNFNITYGDNEYLTGTVGFETVQVGGLKVPKQEFGLVNKAAWEGDGVNTGLLGLCFPNITSVFKGTDPTKDSENEPYLPFFFNAVKDKLVSKPYFSVALNRGSFKAQENSTYDPNLGHLAFGGIAPVATTKPSVKVPMVTLTTKHSGTGYFFYVAKIDHYTFPGSSKLHTASKTTILDTGTTLNYIPTDAAAAYNKAFDPPAYMDLSEGGYVVKCKAKVPAFSVTIGGKAFSIDKKDQLLPLGKKDHAGDALCFSGTQDGGAASDGNIFILGDVFLHNIVATFDISAYELTLTQRKAY